MNTTRAREQWSNITNKYGIKKVLGCGCLGCLVPIVSMMIFAVAVGWWLMSGDSGHQVYSTPRYIAPIAHQKQPVNQQGQPMRTSAPTPIYAPDNAQGAVRNPGLPSMMGNQPLSPEYGYLVEGLADHKPYAGDNSLANKSWYLAQANWTGARRTPYVKGQQLSNGMTVVTGDFDFVLLQDASGAQWFCDPTGLNCQWWR